MALPHATAGQIIDARASGARLVDEKTVALFKARDLEVMRLVLLAGKSLPSHHVAGEITVHCLEGVLDVIVDGRSHVLRAGQLLFLARQAEHSVHALEDASALVTIALGHASAAQGSPREHTD